MIRFLRDLWCRLTLHHKQPRRLVALYGSHGKGRYLVRCEKCGDYYSEPMQ